VATLERLVTTIAEVEGLGAERVRAIARAMREDRLIATRGRGLSAAAMSDRDAANLLIAVNVADTARMAPAMVRRYRRLRTSPRAGSPPFGVELDKLVAAVGTETMADFVSSFVCHASQRSRLIAERYEPEDYELEIQFRKPIPEATIYVTAPRGGRPEVVRFSQTAESSSAIVSDRTVTIMITHRTILAVGQLLRD